ncbi:MULTISPECIES: flavin reductase family protein [unclassified Pseudomonas]|uniref:flavin reductase family protein n=1 Tax=unclassified Pseudomonas TaxID=196821 RepID=UPI00257C36D0|nr:MULTISPECIES: flavin reductase family protein [unclassified Pseudomonas]
MQSKQLEARAFRRVMGKFATGVTVLTYNQDGQPGGMTANAFMSLSVDPPMVLIAVRNQARFAASVKPGDAFGINFLREEDEALSSHFGGRPQAALAADYRLLGQSPVLGGALVQLAVRASAVHPGGDHLIYTAEVEAIEESDGRPLLFYSGAYKQLHALDPATCWFDLG